MLAYELYAALLKPVEAAWQPAKNLIVVTNGALGELPLGLLPTAPSQVDPDRPSRCSPVTATCRGSRAATP